MTPSIKAYVVGDSRGWVLEPASARRGWMDETGGFAYRCLPLALANQAGWVVRSPVGFVASWNGGTGLESTAIQFEPGGEDFNNQITSHFGWGIVTFSLPWLFRTSDGLSLLVRGPTNGVKAHAAPLDGIVETDWAVATFTMNWKITEANRIVRFEKGEPICMISPYPVELLEEVETSLGGIESDPELEREYKAWSASRTAFNADALRKPEDWQKDYMSGRTPEGTKAREHRSRLGLKPFE